MVRMILFRLWIQRVINHQVFLLLLLTAPRIHSYWICSCFWSLAMKRLSVSFVLICPGVCDPLMPCLYWHGVGSFLDCICLLMLMILIFIPFLWLDLDRHIIGKLVISNWWNLYELYTHKYPTKILTMSIESVSFCTATGTIVFCLIYRSI